MSEIPNRIRKFVKYAQSLDGDEKGEAQVFCDRLFIGFGHDGYKEAGAQLEYRIKRKSTKGTSFADLVWKPRALIEMKRRGEKLFRHYKQAFEYWIHTVPNRPRYVVLCNFDEFWIYDFDKQIDEPVDVVALAELPRRYTALNFLFPDNPDPIFGNDREAVSREAADRVAALFNALIARGIRREEAQRFVLQIVVAMFAEDIDLLPAGTVHNIVGDCQRRGQSSYDLFGGLFSEMNSPTQAKGGRFQNVRYFNGGLFAEINPLELAHEELELIGGEEGVAGKDWSKVNPVIFGTLFQKSMDAEERHAYGAHFTSEADILRIVNPTIVKPWQERIAKASSMRELLELRKELLTFKVLDPACGSGNFLYVSYREIVRLEIELLAKLKANFSDRSFTDNVKSVSLIRPHQFFGIDRDSFGVELAKVTLMLAKKLALDESILTFESAQIEMTFDRMRRYRSTISTQTLFVAMPYLKHGRSVQLLLAIHPTRVKTKCNKSLEEHMSIGCVKSSMTSMDALTTACIGSARPTITLSPGNLLASSERIPSGRTIRGLEASTTSPRTVERSSKQFRR